MYAVWAVALYYRSQWAQLAGRRVMMDLRSDLYRHIHRLSHSFFQEKQSGGIVAHASGARGVPAVHPLHALVRRSFEAHPRISEMNTVLHKVSGRVTSNHVSFGYRAGQPVLHDLNVDVAPGEMVALVGPSGAGKSSFAPVVPRFYDPQVGRVMLDGRDLRERRLRELRARIGSVAQNPSSSSSARSQSS